MVRKRVDAVEDFDLRSICFRLIDEEQEVLHPRCCGTPVLKVRSVLFHDGLNGSFYQSAEQPMVDIGRCSRTPRGRIPYIDLTVPGSWMAWRSAMRECGQLHAASRDGGRRCSL